MKRARCWGLGFFWVVSALVAGGRPANAQAEAATQADEARAQELATEAWRLAESQRPVEACVLYRKALELKRSPGLLNNVGRCLEQEGDPVRAIETFERSVDLAKQQEPSPKRQAWLQFARQEIDVLERQVGKLILRLPRIEGLEISVDGKGLPPGTESVYVKPGAHQLEARAPDHVSHSVELTPRAGEHLQVDVPTLAPTPVQAPPPPHRQAPAEKDAPEPTRILPWALIGTGGALVVGGAITGVMASSKGAELQRGCPDGSCPNAGWQDKIDSTKSTALVADVLWGVGLATLGVGVTVLVLSDDDAAPSEQAKLQATCHGSGCGLLLQGRF